jgi:biopolymer transport protein TolQ
MIQFCTVQSRAPHPVKTPGIPHRRALSQRRANDDIAEGCLHTPGSPAIALLLQGVGSLLPTNSGSALLEILANTSPISKVVLLILALYSVGSWGVILHKWWVFRRTRRQTASFLEVFRRSSKFSEVQAVCASLNDSPLVGLFQAGYAELTAQLRQSAPAGDAHAALSANPHGVAGRPTLKSLAGVDRALMRASVVEINKLERHIPYLATTASVTPFIGLFGTVVGIMMAFQGIAQQGGSTNLAVVSRPIADALVATAFGLVAAIPAVIYYNRLTNSVELLASEMDDFAMEFLNIAERNFT